MHLIQCGHKKYALLCRYRVMIVQLSFQQPIYALSLGWTSSSSSISSWFSCQSLIWRSTVLKYAFMSTSTSPNGASGLRVAVLEEDTIHEGSSAKSCDGWGPSTVSSVCFLFLFPLFLFSRGISKFKTVVRKLELVVVPKIDFLHCYFWIIK